MTSDERRQDDIDAFWRDYLTNGDSFERRAAPVLPPLPHGPRCKLCAAPFSGPGAPVMRVIGKRPSDKNPHVCRSASTTWRRITAARRSRSASCSRTSEARRPWLKGCRPRPSAPCSIASTASPHARCSITTAASTSSSAMRSSPSSFLGSSARTTRQPRWSAATDLLRATGHADVGGPWAPVGAGVATGLAWVGAVGDGLKTDVTAVGDTVNIDGTPRLGRPGRRGSRDDRGCASGRARSASRDANARPQGQSRRHRCGDTDGQPAASRGRARRDRAPGAGRR